MCSALVSGHRLKNEIYSCVARLFDGLKNEIYSCSAQVAKSPSRRQATKLSSCVAP